jgi:hypothetical protein
MEKVSEALTAFAEGLTTLGIDPAMVEVSLLPNDWQALDDALIGETSNGLSPGGEIAGRGEWKDVRYLVRFT